MAKTLKPGMLAGNRYKEMIEIEENGEVYELEIQALKKSQSDRVQATLYHGIKANPNANLNNIEVDIADTMQNQSEALILAAEIGLGGDNTGWNRTTIEEELSAESINKIGRRVMTISGIGNVEDVERFRNERKGSK